MSVNFFAAGEESRDVILSEAKNLLLVAAKGWAVPVSGNFFAAAKIVRRRLFRSAASGI
jgi:hypothetical protein